MEMNDKEKAAKIAEMMGWERVDTIHIVNRDGQPTWHWAKDGKYVESGFYDPVNNVAQAFDAAEQLGLFDDPDVLLGKVRGGKWTVCRIGMDGDEYIISVGDTPAAAIADALLAAKKCDA